jgi:hypothetical protein
MNQQKNQHQANRSTSMKKFAVAATNTRQTLRYDLEHLKSLQEKASKLGRRYPHGGYQGL